MATRNIKQIETTKYPEHTWRENWEVMKPFVLFSIKAMGIVAGAVVGIIRLLPVLLENTNHDEKKNDKVIKI